jgi:peroxiredoxin
MKYRKIGKLILFTMLMISTVTLMGWIFWEQELQYSLPTPVPANFVDVKAGDTVDLKNDLAMRENKPALLHFFNFDCPCSRFNMKEFERMAHKYKGEADFFVVIQSEEEDAVEQFQNKYELDIPAVLDKDGVISKKCGIYATPQAVLLDKNSAIYFKGNYNKARFCAKKETRFAEIAMDYLLKNEPLPLFMQYAVSEPYGCSLPSDETVSKSKSLFNLF